MGILKENSENYFLIWCYIFFFPAKWTGLAEKKLNRLGVALDCFYKLQAILKNHPQVLYQIASMYLFLINNQMKCDKYSIFYATNCILYAHFLIGFMLYYRGDNNSLDNMLIHFYIPFRERKFPCYWYYGRFFQLDFDVIRNCKHSSAQVCCQKQKSKKTKHSYYGKILI